MIEKLKMLSDWVLLYKCTRDHVRDENNEILIELTDKTLDNTNYLEIVGYGPKCRAIGKEEVGKVVRCKNWSQHLMNLKRTVGENYWVIREKALLEQSPLLIDMEA